MINELIKIAKQAGRYILDIYHQPIMRVTEKLDGSVLTQADMISHEFICQSLEKLFPSVPILSEESAEQCDYASRKNWEYFFLVDPLDGTKEFIQRNGEFTVNIALIKQNHPVLGVIHAPALDLTYYAEKNKGAGKIMGNNSALLLKTPVIGDPLRVVVSRSHACEKTKAFLLQLEEQNKAAVALSAGSALKFGLIASGDADIYPRYSPTMEWDTAAGQIIVEEVGKQVKLVGSESVLKYNKPELINPGFIVQ